MVLTQITTIAISTTTCIAVATSTTYTNTDCATTIASAATSAFPAHVRSYITILPLLL